jgi:hypothetical protein
MKFYKLGLLTLLISLFILDSCKTQDGIGLDVDPATQINGTLIQDTSITAATVKDDDVVTNVISARMPLAYFKDPEFGTTEASFGAVLSTPGHVAYTKPTGTITIDSALLVLPYVPTGFYGDSLLSQYTINVHHLTEFISRSQTYYNTKVLAFDPDKLGSKTFVARPHDTLKITSIVKGAKDTLIKVRPQVRVPLSTDFINGVFFEQPQTTLTTPAIFENLVKGLYVTLDKNQTTGVGGNMFFNLDSAAVTIYYKNVNGATIDTALVTLPFAQSVGQIKHTYSANVQAALDNTSTNGLVYLQGLAGLRAKLTLPDPKAIFASIGSENVVINRAELVVQVKPGSATPFAPAKRLALYRLDLARQRVPLQDVTTTDPRASGVNNIGVYNPANGEYHFLVTAYLQDLLRGKSVDYGTYLAPVDPLTAVTDVASTASYAERSIIQGKNASYRIKLNIIYTKIHP